MNKVDKHKFIITIIFFIMSFLNYFGFLSIHTYGVFGITFGALMICISTCFEGDLYLGNLDIWKIIKNFFYVIGWIFIVITVYLKQNDVLINLINIFDSNTLMLLSLAFTFLSLMVSDWNQKRQSEIIEKERNKLDELIKIQDQKQIELNKIIDKIKNKNN
jgi:hypothetical protein